ncbi:MAG: hypothetical protein RR248_01015 [Clostridia bacterium]
MINIIYGGEGSGKTAKLISLANEAVDSAKGILVYIDKNNSKMHVLDHTIKLLDLVELGICNVEQFIAFIKGMVSGNYDIQTVYVDNLEKITGKTANEFETLFNQLETLVNVLRVNFVITIGCNETTLPEYIKKYI